MRSVERTGFERLEQALSTGAPAMFRRSMPSQIATIVGAPVFTWLIWRGSGLHHPFFWLLLATLWAFWYFYLLSPFSVSIEGPSVSVRWWYRRVTVARSAVSLEPRPTATSRLFGYDFIAVGEVGKFPIWPAWFLVTEKGVEEGSD